MFQEPTAHRISPETGALANASGRYDKRLIDLDGIYFDAAAFRAAAAARGDRVVYSVQDMRPSRAPGDITFGTTFMEPGRIGDEYYMTRGHIHAVANRPEVYYGESGAGLMLMESPEGETRILEVAPRVAVYVPPMWVHRSVNVGATPLVMSFFYPSDSGQDYDIIARSAGMASLIVADGTGWKAVRNPGYRPRDPQEVAQIYATQN